MRKFKPQPKSEISTYKDGSGILRVFKLGEKYDIRVKDLIYEGVYFDVSEDFALRYANWIKNQWKKERKLCETTS